MDLWVLDTHSTKYVKENHCHSHFLYIVQEHLWNIDIPQELWAWVPLTRQTRHLSHESPAARAPGWRILLPGWRGTCISRDPILARYGDDIESCPLTRLQHLADGPWHILHLVEDRTIMKNMYHTSHDLFTVYCDIIFIHWTFNFVYLMGWTIHGFKSPTKCWFNLILVSLFDNP